MGEMAAKGKKKKKKRKAPIKKVSKEEIRLAFWVKKKKKVCPHSENACKHANSPQK